MSSDHRLCVFVSEALAGGDIRLADYAGRPILDRQHRLALRLHAAICRLAGIVDRVQRSRPDDHRHSFQRFRRDRNRAARPRSPRPRSTSMASPSRSRRKAIVKGRMRIRSTNGRRRRGRRMFRAGTSTNTWSAVTAILPTYSPRVRTLQDTRVETAVARGRWPIDACVINRFRRQIDRRGLVTPLPWRRRLQLGYYVVRGGMRPGRRPKAGAGSGINI